MDCPRLVAAPPRYVYFRRFQHREHREIGLVLRPKSLPEKQMNLAKPLIDNANLRAYDGLRLTILKLMRAEFRPFGSWTTIWPLKLKEI
jgi:hypothetical protein